MKNGKLVFSLITCSDTRDLAQDTAGAALEELIAQEGWLCAARIVVKDEREVIARSLAQACAQEGVDVVLTCGGSGLSLRDVTPDATQDVCERFVPGIAEAMRAHSMRKTPYAALSRAVVMQKGRVLVVNLPGSEKAARENWEVLPAILPHAVSMMKGEHHG